MSRGQTRSNAQRNGRQSSVLKSLAHEGKRSRGIERKESLKPARKSTRLQEIQQKSLLPSPSATNSFGEEFPRDSPALGNAPNPDRKRKQSQEAEYPTPQDQEKPAEKRVRTSLESNTAKDREVVSDTNNKKSDSINHWIQEGSWPKKDFEREINMTLPLARKKSTASLRRQALDPSSVTPSQKTEDKSAPYKDPSYASWLAENGSFLVEHRQGITDKSKKECQILLKKKQVVPQDSLFRNDLFQNTCDKLRDRNEARVISDISLLIVPSAETLATYGATHLEHLVVGINERWNKSIPITTTAVHPQPDFSVGFKRSAFTQDQLKKLEPFTGNVYAATKLCSLFLATWRMYFPFFTCEVKCGTGGLDIADRQNSNSMTLAVRGIVELFNFVKRGKELHRKILAFSISHDDKAVRIFGHYPVINGNKTEFYRHPIRDFVFKDLDGKEKWTAYKFTKSIYDVWMPKHYKLVCEAIDDIPSCVSFGASLGDSFKPVASADESEPPDPQEMATSASASQEKFKKPRLTTNAMLKEQNDGLKEQIKDLMSMMKEQATSNANTGNELESLREMKQENDQLRQEIKEQAAASNARIDQLMQENKARIDQLMDMLKQRLS